LKSSSLLKLTHPTGEIIRSNKALCSIFK